MTYTVRVDRSRPIADIEHAGLSRICHGIQVIHLECLVMYGLQYLCCCGKINTAPLKLKFPFFGYLINMHLTVYRPTGIAGRHRLQSPLE